jgi:DNA-binding beta-propeller fold protein YncE
MKQRVKHNLTVLLAMSFLLPAGIVSAEGNVSASYLYTLSNFAGILPVSWVSISVDESRDEAYVLPGQGVKIFNDKGMEIYSFNDAGEIPSVVDVAADNEGNIIIISNNAPTEAIIRCNYRGEPISKIELKNLPPEFSGFFPNRVFFRKGSFYFASLLSKKVIVTDREGLFKDGYDIAALLKLDEQDERNRDDSGIVGFSVDQEGNILFTMPVIAKAYVVSPDKQVRSFGSLGSRPGMFGVAGGITVDASGKFILVADTLRCVVTVFDRNFKFQTEFGFRGLGPSNLVGPMQLAVDSKNRLYVTQLRNRGVSVYQIALTS